MRLFQFIHIKLSSEYISRDVKFLFEFKITNKYYHVRRKYQFNYKRKISKGLFKWLNLNLIRLVFTYLKENKKKGWLNIKMFGRNFPNSINISWTWSKNFLIWNYILLGSKSNSIYYFLIKNKHIKLKTTISLIRSLL